MHAPVMLKEVVTALAVQPGGRYIDATLGAGGHSSAILKHSTPGGQLLGIDADPKAIAAASKKLAAYEGATMLVNDHFTNLKDICTRYDFSPVHGILLDLGLSSMQLSETGSGFSFKHDAPLDMRFSPDQEISADDIVNSYTESQMENIIRTYGEERQSRQIARAIIRRRPIHRTVRLAEVITEAVGGRRGRIHPATRTFQALRIAVNRELEQLESVLTQAIGLLGIEGRLVVISYHSLEDRIVKRFLQRESRDCICPPDIPECICNHQARVKMISRRIIAPRPDEVKRNPRSRSARMRVAERTAERESSFADYLNVMAENDATYVWKRPVMMEKVRRAFMALQVENIRIV